MQVAKWGVNMSEQEIINKMSHMSMVGIAYQNNHDLDQPEIVNLLVIGFSGISQKNPKILLKMLLERMMKVFLFLMKVLVAVFLMV